MDVFNPAMVQCSTANAFTIKLPHIPTPTLATKYLIKELRIVAVARKSDKVLTQRFIHYLVLLKFHLALALLGDPGPSCGVASREPISRQRTPDWLG